MGLIRTLRKKARGTAEILYALHPSHRGATAIAQMEKRNPPALATPSTRHLQAAMEWLKLAQNSSETGGVAWGYRARRAVRTDFPLGWVAPYPETTGYLIPTLIRYSDLSGDPEFLYRAKRMSSWELEIQLEDGGFQGGTLGELPVSSSTFVTGQVLFGLLAACERFPSPIAEGGAVRAGEFLLDCLDDTGRFVRGYSQFCEPGPKAYEVRTGLALAELGEMFAEKRYREAASRTADFALSVQERNGWFGENDLDYHDQPLTHTIGYVLEGLLGIGVRLDRGDCLDGVERALDAIVPLIEANGFLAGRWRSDWCAAADWCCLTGSAQIAGVFLRMHERTGRREYLEAGRALLGFVCHTQELESGVAELDGGIHGSYPFHGEYGQWCVLNGATKFFCDAVLDYLRIARPAESGEAHDERRILLPARQR